MIDFVKELDMDIDGSIILKELDLYFSNYDLKDENEIIKYIKLLEYVKNSNGRYIDIYEYNNYLKNIIYNNIFKIDNEEKLLKILDNLCSLRNNNNFINDVLYYLENKIDISLDFKMNIINLIFKRINIFYKSPKKSIKQKDIKSFLDYLIKDSIKLNYCYIIVINMLLFSNFDKNGVLSRILKDYINIVGYNKIKIDINIEEIVENFNI